MPMPQEISHLRLSLWFIAVAKSNPIFGKLASIISSLIPHSLIENRKSKIENRKSYYPSVRLDLGRGQTMLESVASRRETAIAPNWLRWLGSKK